MHRRFIGFILCSSLVLALTARPAIAQGTEERFQDLFITAGYSTAFGAALGACFLAFSADPSSQLQYVAMGASLGFIGGSILGSYVIFSPMFVDNNPQDFSHPDNVQSKYAIKDQTRPQSSAFNLQPISTNQQQTSFFVQPVINYKTAQVTSVIGGLNIATF